MRIDCSPTYSPAGRRPNQYAPSSQTRYYTLHRARFVMKAASVLLLIGCVFWSGVKFVDGVVSVRETESVDKQVRFYEERYARARERLPPTPAESRDMKLAVEMAGTIRAFKTSPMAMLVKISDGLEGFPSVQVERVDWTASTNPDTAFGSKDRAKGLLDELLGGGSDEEVPTASVLYQIAEVSGRIDPFSGDYREALDMVSAFADSLRNLPEVLDVQVVSLPLDIGIGIQPERRRGQRVESQGGAIRATTGPQGSRT